MKKRSLATILALSAVSVFSYADNAQTTATKDADKPTLTQPAPRDGKCDFHDGKKHHGDRKYRGEDKPRGGFVDPAHPVKERQKARHPALNLPVAKVADSASWKDDQVIVLQGKIVEQVGKEDFLFRDASGEITVEIEGRAWRGQEITPNDEVKLIGEVDKSWKKTEIEIHHIEKVK
ncbi:YgiW/YdeI family stress tolerance OB fold protein [Caviibacterium pharyngocola]|uniref:Uncharacterized protein n=1 Tax=Caviibacterium pharyngocola TaxID=28159 RepID=A0A2M8RT03_9PAST|nr:NirD/YgiW/YdeI family stress tolerance protein [Caviibacterium pharyngocola]PJG82012.1 hypothetical protein CVP04_11580 [Caviibacterium pharyngocola]